MSTGSRAVSAHAAIADARRLTGERRALYLFAVRLLVGNELAVPESLLDNPLFRHAVGEALGGRLDLTAENLDEARYRLGASVEVSSVRVAADRDANELLAAPLRTIERQMPVAGASLRLLTEDADSFPATLDNVRLGIEIARRVSPELVDDLLAHLELALILDPSSSGGLISASSRYFPGLIAVEEPESPMAFAEALVHEGAHLKFFDLASCYDFLDVESDLAGSFAPSWSKALWPVEQALAAWHTYTCLSFFGQDLGSSDDLAGTSLIPHAHERSRELADWLLSKQCHLGRDARALLFALSGEPACDEVGQTQESALDGRYVTRSGVSVLRPADSPRMLAGFASSRDVFWLDDDVADALDVLLSSDQPIGLQAMRATLSDQWPDVADADRRMKSALDRLLRSDLIGESVGPPRHGAV